MLSKKGLKKSSKGPGRIYQILPLFLKIFGKVITPLKTREAIKEDFPQIESLFLEVQKYDTNFDKDVVFDEKTEKETKRSVRRHFIDPNGKFFVAEDKGRIIGFVFVYFSPAILKSGWINEIFVTEAFRRNGIGSKLMEKGIEWLKQKGAKKVELTAYKTNQEALSFYKKHHFEKQPAKFIRLGRKIK